MGHVGKAVVFWESSKGRVPLGVKNPVQLVNLRVVGVLVVAPVRVKVALVVFLRNTTGTFHQVEIVKRHAIHSTFGNISGKHNLETATVRYLEVTQVPDWGLMCETPLWILSDSISFAM